MAQEKLPIILAAIIVVGIYLLWIDWDYTTVLPPKIQQSAQPHLENIPQLESEHSELNLSLEQCAQRAEDLLRQMQFQQVSKNGSYVYGRLPDHRVAIKCIDTSKGTFMYAIVAGQDQHLIEQLKQQIALKMRQP